MRFQEWEPVYRAILADFGFPREHDERARDVLAELFDGSGTFDPRELPVPGATVAVAGGAPRLEEDTKMAEDADLVFAASDAATRLRESGVSVDCMVTDLDKVPRTVRELTDEGTPVAVHAHGDNIPSIERIVPDLRSEEVVPTTQAEPAGPVENFGGFTDGDRAAFLADHLGADRLVFPGWEFDDESVGSVKRRKLEWAECLLYWLERRRDERFHVLDSRRAGVDTSALPTG